MHDNTPVGAGAGLMPDQLESRLGECPVPDRPVFRRRLRGIRRREASGRPIDRALRALGRDMESAIRRRTLRKAAPVPSAGPVELPISQRHEAIAGAIANHQVVIVCGETGSGKSTQLPRICMSLGLGVEGMIAHTQPRRLAARTLAARIAEELETGVGEAVGYKVRFADRVGEGTRLKLLTDGMLLAEIQGDPDLRGYDTVIVDEAHERSLNIDFLLGYLKRLLPRRPDLRVIITSATIDPERFARHFDGAPVVEVSGRTFPVEIRYRPLLTEADHEDDRDMLTGVVDAVEELAAEGQGDVLVFLPTERDIREAAEALRKRHPPHSHVLPLYARLSVAEQQRVFAPHAGRRIILSTNVAETSVTVPGIRYVVDTGLVRMSRYSFRTKVQRLPIEPISRASARQRSGRCGRTAPGICIRLYSEADLDARPAFTDPEINRTNLAAVILQMEAQGLGKVEDFPFVEPPDRRFITDGYRLLHELGAVDEQARLTGTGRRLARFPLDPSIARMLLTAEREGVLSEVLIIGAALSVQDPRERPLDAQQAADEAHAVWQDPESDFAGFLNLWRGYRAAAANLSRNRLRSWARERVLSVARLRDWDDIHRQLKELVGGMGMRVNREPGDAEGLRRALLSGLLGSVARRDEDGNYVGARGLRLAIFPGSALARRKPDWIMAAELVETSRVFARVAARIEPVEVERLAAHLVKRAYSDPHWDHRAGRVRAYETVTLYGLVLVGRRAVNYGRIDPHDAREIFLRQGLAEDRVDSPGDFLRRNRALMESIRRLEDKSRRRDLLVDADAVHAFYAARVPDEVNDLRGFERWRQEAEAAQPELLHMTTADLMLRPAGEEDGDRFPDHLVLGTLRLPLEYRFEPGHEEDGVTAILPLAAMNQVRPEECEWLVPGLLEDKLLHLIRGLPKRLRRNFVPAPEFTRALLESLSFGKGSLLDGMRRELRRMTGVEVSPEEWAQVRLPQHLHMRFRVIDADGGELASGRDLAALQERFGGAAATTGAATPAAGGWDREGIQRWDFGDIPPEIEFTQQGITVRAYPALEDSGRDVRQVLADSREAAARLNRRGVQRLLVLALRGQVQLLERRIAGHRQLQLQHAPLGNTGELRDTVIRGIVDHVFLAEGVPVTASEFRHTLERGREHVVAAGDAFIDRVVTVMERYHRLRKGLGQARGLTVMDSIRDMSEHLEHLVYPGFLDDLPRPLLHNLPRYLEALCYRLDRLDADPARDCARIRQVRPWWEKCLERAARHHREGVRDPALIDFRLMLEEFRISLFAQPVGASMPVSEKRLAGQWQQVR